MTESNNLVFKTKKPVTEDGVRSTALFVKGSAIEVKADVHRLQN